MATSSATESEEVHEMQTIPKPQGTANDLPTESRWRFSARMKRSVKSKEQDSSKIIHGVIQGQLYKAVPPPDYQDENKDLKDRNKLKALPTMLKKRWLIPILAYNMGCLGGVVYFVYRYIYVRKTIPIHTTHIYLISRYMPSILGMLTTIVFRSIVSAYIRIERYIEMARDDRFESGRLTHAEKVFFMKDPSNVDGHNSWNTIYHYLVVERNFLPAILMITHILLSILLVACKTRLLVVSLDSDGVTWTLSISVIFGGILIGIYFILIVVLFVLIYHLWGRTTGLKWDVSSLADQMALVQGSDILEGFEGMEYLHHGRNFKGVKRDIFKSYPLRLGYWRVVANQKEQYWYGIAFAYDERKAREVLAKSHRRESDLSISASWLDHRASPTTTRLLALAEQEVAHSSAPPLVSKDANGYSLSEGPRYRHGESVAPIEKQFFVDVPYVLNDEFLVFAFLAAGALLVLSSIGIHNHDIDNGIMMNINSTNLQLANSSNPALETTLYLIPALKKFGFRYGAVQFIAVLIMSWFSVFWSDVDRFHRVTQPFVGMAKASPPAENLLLTYPQDMQIIITFNALRKNHLKVAWFSALALVSNSGPVFATGLFTRQGSDMNAKIKITKSEFWASFAFLILFIISLVFARPTNARRLPRRIRNPIDIYTYCYASHILDDHILGQPIFQCKNLSDEQIHLVSRLHLDKAKYRFGLYLGKDGRRHIGFDKDERILTVNSALEGITATDIAANAIESSNGTEAGPSAVSTGGTVPSSSNSRSVYVDTVEPGGNWLCRKLGGIFFWTNKVVRVPPRLTKRGGEV